MGASSVWSLRAARWAAMALLVVTAAGCGYPFSARLWADTALADGGFSLHRHQWAYDGETVTFELECSPSPAMYVVFGIDGKETVINIPQVAGRYRWTHVFAAGLESQTYEVYAVPFLLRGKCDWICDNAKDTWSFYPGVSNLPDVQTAPERVMKITCYRVEIHQRFAGRGGPPRRVELGLIKVSGERKSIPRREGTAPDARGFLVQGPDKNNTYDVTYTPTREEVSRAAKTRVELVVEHADGAVERLVQDVDTP